MQYRFAEFELDLSQQELRRLGESVHIEPQVFDLIVHLVRNHDRIVSKDELIDTVWNGRIISDAALSSRINGARRALCDNGTDLIGEGGYSGGNILFPMPNTGTGNVLEGELFQNTATTVVVTNGTPSTS